MQLLHQFLLEVTVLLRRVDPSGRSKGHCHEWLEVLGWLPRSGSDVLQKTNCHVSIHAKDPHPGPHLHQHVRDGLQTRLGIRSQCSMPSCSDRRRFYRKGMPYKPSNRSPSNHHESPSKTASSQLQTLGKSRIHSFLNGTRKRLKVVVSRGQTVALCNNLGAECVHPCLKLEHKITHKQAVYEEIMTSQCQQHHQNLANLKTSCFPEKHHVFFERYKFNDPWIFWYILL